MKKIILSIFVIIAAASVSSNVFAQEPPAGGSDSDLRDNNIRMRSNELERIKRDSAKPKSSGADSNSAAQMNSEIDAKYPQIKEDYEGMQMAQAAIIKAYSTGESIDYKQIETSAGEINKSAKRLDANLFSAKEEDKENTKKDEQKKAKSIRDLIVELDDAIGNFVQSAMFQNLRVVNPEVAGKARLELTNILKLSETLSKEAGKL